MIPNIELMRCSRAFYRFRERLALVLSTSLVLSAVRVGIWILPFPWVLRIVEAGAAHKASRPGGTSQVKRLTAVVQRLGRFSPLQGRCLAEALTAKIVLGQAGIQGKFRIGVCLGVGGGIRAHAWLESEEGDILIGGPASRLKQFVVLENQRNEWL